MIVENVPELPDSVYSEGASLISSEYQRETPDVKTTNFLHAIRLDPLRQKKKAIDILYHFNENVTECTRCNFFMVLGKSLITPKENILRGITRNLVLVLGQKSFVVEERNIGLAALSFADEAFITSTSKKNSSNCEYRRP